MQFPLLEYLMVATDTTVNGSTEEVEEEGQNED